jgi:hypothetical protein
MLCSLLILLEEMQRTQRKLSVNNLVMRRRNTMFCLLLIWFNCTSCMCIQYIEFIVQMYFPYCNLQICIPILRFCIIGGKIYTF